MEFSGRLPVRRASRMAQSGVHVSFYALARLGRDPELVRIAPAVFCIVGETRAMAEAKAAYIEKPAHPLDSLVRLSEVLNYDVAKKGLDEPFTDVELAGLGGLQALRDRVVQHSGRGTLGEMPRFVSTPKAVADGLEEWFDGRARDGFVVAATHMPGAYEDFARLVVPEPQRRGLFHREYAGPTLRENLGLPRPGRGEWGGADR